MGNMELNKMKNKTIIVVVVVAVLVLLAWGLVGSSEAAKVGTTCDFGLGKSGDVLCWNWHRNIIGNIQDAINK